VDELSAFGDLNSDGIDDAAVVLIESSGGSGTFSYVATVLNQENQPVNEATLLLGDRVSIKSIAIQDGHILVEFIEQNEKIQNAYQVQDDTLVERGSENLGALSVSDLEGPTWMLTVLGPGQDLVPETEITAVFAEGKISGSSGCNNYSAGVTDQGQGTLSIGLAMGTMMTCAEAVMQQEGDFMAKLATVTHFSFSGGHLLLTHKDGVLIFAPRTSGPGQPEAPLHPPKTPSLQSFIT
jgi:heat shock protein HslJ